MGSIRTGFVDQMNELDSTVRRMGGFVGQMLDDALKALLQQDVELARSVRVRDDIADDMDEEIETQATRLLALQQPMARDLRTITAALKIVTELERIGDYAVAIAKTAIALADEPYFKPLEDTARMAELTRNIVFDAMRAYEGHDVDFAKSVRDKDKAIDALWNLLEEELIGHMARDPKVVQQAARLILVARYLERIGDHAKNITERVAYRETGHRKPWRKAKAAGESGESA